MIRTIKQRINEARAELPNGYFLVTNSFRLSPGGGWAITFKKDNLIYYDAKTKKLTSFSTGNPNGVNRRPPIEGVQTLDISRYGGADGMLADFESNTKSLSKKEFEKLKAELSNAIDTVIASLKNYSQDQLKSLKAALDKMIK